MPSSKNLDNLLNQLDDDTKSEFTAFLEERQNSPPTTELTSHGGKLSEFYAGRWLGVWNPEGVTYDTFDKMRQHPQIAAGLAAIKLPILATNWTVSCQDEDIAAFCYQTLRPLWRGLVRSSLTAIDYGVAFHEKVWEIKELSLKREDKEGNTKTFYNRQAAVYKKLKSLHPQWIRILIDGIDNFGGIHQQFRGNDVDLKPNKVFVFTHAKGENFGNLYGTSRLKNIYDIWYWWMALSQFMMRYFERRASPAVVVRTPIGKSKEGKEHSLTGFEMGKALINDMVVTLPSKLGSDGKTPLWDIDYLQDQPRGELFVSALNSLEIKMLRGLFVPERVLTQDLRTGSYALSRTHFNIFIMELDGLVADLEDHFTRYVVRPLVEYNFGATAPQAFVEMERLSQQRREFLAKVFFEMAKSGMVAPALKEIARELKIPIDESSPKPPEKEAPEEEKTPPKDTEAFELEEGKKKRSWWREPFPHENAKVLEDIEDTLDNRKKEFTDALDAEILTPQLDMTLKEVEKALKGKQPLKNIWFRTVKGMDDYGNPKEFKVPWEPLKPKLQTRLSAYLREMYDFGQSTAIEEMDLKENAKTDSEDLDMLKSRAIAVSDRWISNIKYSTEMATLNVANKTAEDIKWDIKQEFQKFRNKNLPDIAETEGMTAINLGRRRVIKRHS